MPREYKKYEGKTPEANRNGNEEVCENTDEYIKSITRVDCRCARSCRSIYAPTFVVQARHDEMINTDSANIIYNSIESPCKRNEVV